MKKVLDLKRQNKCKRLLFCLLTTDMQRLCLLWHYWKTLPFLSTPHVNNATFQRINFVKLKFIWISLNIFKKNKYVIEINIGAYLLFLSIPKEQYFLYWSQRIAAWLSTSFTLKFVNFFTQLSKILVFKYTAQTPFKVLLFDSYRGL